VPVYACQKSILNPVAVSYRGWCIIVRVWCRNVHPTTQLLQPFPGSPHLSPGILAISSRSVQLCTCLGSTMTQPGSSGSQATSSSAALREAAAAAAAGGAGSGLLGAGVCVRQAEVLQWTLGGLPLSCVALSDGCYLVGDSRAGGNKRVMAYDSCVLWFWKFMAALHLALDCIPVVPKAKALTAIPCGIKSDGFHLKPLHDAAAHLHHWLPIRADTSHSSHSCPACLTCCCPTLWTGLHLFKLPHSSSSAGTCIQLQTSGCLAVPDVLLYVPFAVHPPRLQQPPPEQGGREQQQVTQQLSGLLVVGSRCSSSQVVGIPQQLWEVAAGGGYQMLQQQQVMKLPILQSALSPSLAGAQAVAVYEDPSGEACCVCRLAQAAHRAGSSCTQSCQLARHIQAGAQGDFLQ
jgi:hypothetical protein